MTDAEKALEIIRGRLEARTEKVSSIVGYRQERRGRILCDITEHADGSRLVYPRSADQPYTETK